MQGGGVLPEESLASVQDADLIRALASLSVEQVRPSVYSLTFNSLPEKCRLNLKRCNWWYKQKGCMLFGSHGKTKPVVRSEK